MRIDEWVFKLSISSGLLLILAIYPLMALKYIYSFKERTPALFIHLYIYSVTWHIICTGVLKFGHVLVCDFVATFFLFSFILLLKHFRHMLISLSSCQQELCVRRSCTIMNAATLVEWVPLLNWIYIRVVYVHNFPKNMKLQLVYSLTARLHEWRRMFSWKDVFLF